MSAPIFERVQDIASNLFQVPSQKITPQSSPEQIQTWDSLQHLNLMLALEEQFDLRFEPEEMDQMKTIGHITHLVEKKLAPPV